MDCKKYKVLIFDCYNIFYRWNYNVEERIVTIDNQKTHVEGIIAFIKAIDFYINKFGDSDTKCYFLFDNAQTVYERKELSSMYKGNRNKPQDWFYRELDLCELILHYYRDNSFIFRVPKYEADDFVSNIIKSYVKSDEDVLMISEDMDWSKYLSNENPVVHQYMKKNIMDVQKFIELEKFEPSESNITFYKTFYGDPSDNIIGCLPNLPFAFFLKIIDTYTHISDFIKEVDSISYLDLGWKLKVEKEKNNLLTNWELIESATIDNVELSTHSYKCRYEKNKLQILYSSLNIMGLIDNRIKNENPNHSIFDMLDGESLSRKQ